MDELSITHSQDQVVGLSEKMMTVANAEVDDIVQQSLMVGDPDVALAWGYGLILTSQLKGMQLARLLYNLEEKWDSFQTDDTVQDAVFKGMGVSGRKFVDYTRMYRYILKDHPELAGKPIGGLLEIIAAARDGDFTEEHWADLALAHDKAAMIAIRQRARGLFGQGYTRVTIGWDRDGFVWAYKQDEEPEAIGQIKHSATTEHGAVAIDRLMDDRVLRR